MTPRHAPQGQCAPGAMRGSPVLGMEIQRRPSCERWARGLPFDIGAGNQTAPGIRASVIWECIREQPILELSFEVTTPDFYKQRESIWGREKRRGKGWKGVWAQLAEWGVTATGARRVKLMRPGGESGLHAASKRDLRSLRSLLEAHASCLRGRQLHPRPTAKRPVPRCWLRNRALETTALPQGAPGASAEGAQGWAAGIHCCA